jgi:antitoxin (DNA-binding transcriptional repressor) of toxin-antitoxin stability system
MKRVTASDARKNWFRLLDEVAAGEVVCLERKGHRILITRDDADSTSDRIPDYSEFLVVSSPDDADRWGWEWSTEGDLEPTTREDNE